MTNKQLLSALLTTAAITSAVFAQQPQTTTPTAKPGEAVAAVPAPAEAKEAEASPLSLDASVNYVTAYFFRGYNFGDSGLILQPEATISYDIAVNDDLTITPWFNVWNNVTDQHYPDGDYWDEVDLTPAVDITYDRFTLSLQYIYYNSPVNNFGDVQELGAVLSYDDSEQLGLPVALNPYVGYFQEISNDDGDNRSYAEVGIKPEWTPDEKCPVTFSFPITVGLNADGWYFNDDGDQTLLGYGSAAAVATYNVTDHVYLTAGIEYLYLFADNIRQINDGDQNQFIGTLGIGCQF